jgi:hypothetical protein
MLNEGSGSVIVEFTSDETTADRMIAGLDVTVSQSSYFEKANCSVCGNDYFGEHCTHVAGENYTIKKDEIEVDVKCVANVSGFSPIELSIVNTPANDTSVIYVLDASITTPSSDSSEESKIDDIENKCKDNVDDKTKPTEDKDRMFKEMLKDTLTQNIKKDISDNAELLKAFGDLFDASTEDQMPLVKTLMDEIAKVVETVKLETVVDSSAEEEVAEEVKPVEDAVHAEEEVAEDEAEKHVEEVSVEDEATDEKSVEDKIKDALGVIKKEKTTKDNKVLNTLIKGLKL